MVRSAPAYGVAELKARLSEILDRLEKTGEPVVITRRGVPFAEIRPATAHDDDPWGPLRGRLGDEAIESAFAEPLDWDCAR